MDTYCSDIKSNMLKLYQDLVCAIKSLYINYMIIIVNSWLLW